MSTCADYRKTKMDKLISPPQDLVSYILRLAKWPFSYLEGIVSYPVLREDGSLLSINGYDEPSGLYYHPSEDLIIPEIPEHPTKDDAIQANRLIMEEVFVDFPFEDDASRANALAGLLSPVVRPMIKGHVPMMLMDKPSLGTGASLIMEIISIIAIGEVAEMKSPPSTEDEWRKVITSALRGGSNLMFLDNIETTLRSPSLARVLTSSIWSDRYLGKSEILSLPQRSCWYANGNRLALSGDLPRRCYLVQMDAKMARPWERDTDLFRHPDIRGWVKDNRGELLTALLTMARAWVDAGHPPGTRKVLGGYEEWVKILGGILSYAGVSGFLDNSEILYRETDEGNDQWQRFFEVWYSIFGDRNVESKDVIMYLHKPDHDFAIEAPEEISKAMGGSKAGRVIRVAKALGKKEKVRYANGHMLIKHKDKRDNKKLWQLKKFDDAPGG
jgi:hypothetical protein